MAPLPQLSVVIPTRDEAANVGPLLSRLRAAVAGIDLEVIVVDDSDDGTELLLRAEAAAWPAVTVAHRVGVDRQGGLSTAVLTGIRSARGEFVCVMDADLQHPPETIPAMLAAAQAGSDVVVASRYVRGGSRAGLAGTGRRLVSRGATMTARALFSEARACTDPLSGFFLCRRRVIDGIEFRPVGFKVLLELLVCVPGLTVHEVPLGFAARAAGASKANLRQGVLFLRHIRSLFVDVQGSARPWKFGLVGLSGLAILLPLVAVLTGVLGVPPLAAFLPAYGPSLAWNTILNRHWTFADQRHGIGEGAARYLERAAASGTAMFATYAGLLALRTSPVVAALGGVVVAMLVNAAANRAAVQRRPRLWAEVAMSQGVQAVLTRIAAQVGADRAYILPPAGANPAALPAGAIERVVSTRRGAIFIESATHRTQRRSNIAVGSTMVAPIVDGSTLRGLLVCERLSSHAFDTGQLEAAMTAAPALASVILEGDGATADVGLRGRAVRA
jgi:dolichol-phosphate mannosyltransferase